MLLPCTVTETRRSNRLTLRREIPVTEAAVVTIFERWIQDM